MSAATGKNIKHFSRTATLSPVMKKGTQRDLVIAAIMRCPASFTRDHVVGAIDRAAYEKRFKHGKQVVLIHDSVEHHLRALADLQQLVEVVPPFQGVIEAGQDLLIGGNMDSESQENVPIQQSNDKPDKARVADLECHGGITTPIRVNSVSELKAYKPEKLANPKYYIDYEILRGKVVQLYAKFLWEIHPNNVQSNWGADAVLQRLSEDSFWATTEINRDVKWKILAQRYISTDVHLLWSRLSEQRKPFKYEFFQETYSHNGKEKRRTIVVHEHVVERDEIRKKLQNAQSENDIKDNLLSAVSCVVSNRENALLGKRRMESLFECSL